MDITLKIAWMIFGAVTTICIEVVLFAIISWKGNKDDKHNHDKH